MLCNSENNSYDVVIAGSGFSGSLLGWILASQGKKVLIVDRQKHPRFAIGESSTPTADFLLAHIADRWNLKALAPLACWGTWKSRTPEVICGKKRGFSYYRHRPGQVFSDDPDHNHSLLVAASSSDYWSDTHWLRSSVDHFFVEQAIAAGCRLLEHWTVQHAEYCPHAQAWTIDLSSVHEERQRQDGIRCSWFVDASGAGNALARFVDNPPDDAWMKTQTRAVFGHFTGVAPFDQARSSDDPFCGDDAAQHHVLDHGWCWMLRMDNGTTSVGMVEPTGSPWTTIGNAGQPTGAATPDTHFQSVLKTYPSVAGLLAGANRIAPPGAMGFLPRLSRCRRQAVGDGWVLMPVTFGFVDPLHSSGIAHALSGVLRIAEALLSDSNRCRQLLFQYSEDVRHETEWLDLLVAGCYAALPSFRAFQAFACLYFMSAIRFEQQLAKDPSSWPLGFLQSRDPELKPVAIDAYGRLPFLTADPHRSADCTFSELIRRAIEPWNSAGLLDPANKNRIAHSAAPKYAHIATGT